MIQIRKSEDRGHANHGWLDTHYTFSFNDYYDPKHMGFQSLRVINEDRVSPGRGFGTHGHRDMEILTYVLEGSLAHKDSMGHEERLGPNEIQRMSAGTGIMHSEFNPSATEPLHLLQIWIEPAQKNLKPSYEQLGFSRKEKQGKWKLLASPQGGNGAAMIHQDAQVFVAELGKGQKLEHTLTPGRHAWLHVIRGSAVVNGTTLQAGDAASISNEEKLTALGASAEPSELLLFDLA